MNRSKFQCNVHTPGKETVRVLLIEASAEMEMSIAPNVAVLVAAVKKAGFDIEVFSTNCYKRGERTGDEVRVNTLQVPPSDSYEISIKPKESDIKSDFRETVKRYNPHIIGLSTTEPGYELGIDLLKTVEKKKYFTIVGGAYPTLCPEEVILEGSVDAVCVGEGEGALVELCQAMQLKKLNYEIKNLWFKVDSGIVKNPGRPLVNLDDVPFQDWSPWKMHIPPRASKAMAGKIRTTALVELTRGCPYSCNFCANHFLNKTFKRNYRERSVDRFIEESKYLRKKYNLGFIYIVDEAILTTSEKRFKEFTGKYSAVGLPFWCQSRPESVTYNKVKSLKEAGLQAINIGIESGNFSFRKKILNRQVSDDTIITSFREATRTGTRVGANVIIGFPGETRKHIFETIALVRESRPTSTMVHLFQPYIKTPLREVCIEKGLIKDNHKCGDYRIEPIGTGVLSSTELLGLQRTFNLYADLPENRWDEVREAENFDKKGNGQFARLAREYQLKHFGRASF